MRMLMNIIIPAVLAVSGCVVVPSGPRAYIGGARVAVIAPTPVLVVRPYYRYRW